MPDIDPTLVYLSPATAVIGDTLLTDIETRALIMVALLGYESCSTTSAERLARERRIPRAEAEALVDSAAAAVATELGLPLAVAESVHTKLVAGFRRLSLPAPATVPA